MLSASKRNNYTKFTKHIYINSHCLAYQDIYILWSFPPSASTLGLENSTAYPNCKENVPFARILITKSYFIFAIQMCLHAFLVLYTKYPFDSLIDCPDPHFVAMIKCM